MHLFGNTNNIVKIMTEKREEPEKEFNMVLPFLTSMEDLLVHTLLCSQRSMEDGGER